MNEYWKQRKRVAAEFRAEVAEIVGKLGPAFRLEPARNTEDECEVHENCRVTVGKDGAAITLSKGWRDAGRMTISGEWPWSESPVDGSRHQWKPSDTVEITISRGREPAKVAKDIQNRLLKGYLPEFARMLALKELHESHEKRRKEVAESLRRVCKKPYNPGNNGYGRGSVADISANGLHVQVHQDSNGGYYVSLEGRSMRLDMATAALKALAAAGFFDDEPEAD